MSSQSQDIAALQSGASACGPRIHEVVARFRRKSLAVAGAFVVARRQLAVLGRRPRRRHVARQSHPTPVPATSSTHAGAYAISEAEQHGGAEGQRERQEVRPEELR